MTKINDIVAALLQMKGMNVEQMLARLRLLFPDAGLEEVDRAFEIAAEEMRERAKAAAAEREWMESVAPLFDGLEEGTTLEEAAAIKAMQGDPFAARVLVAFASPRYRLNSALCEAAMKADAKNWRQDEKEVWHWLGEGDMPDEGAMIERFQLNHPAEARRIEDEIMGTA
jgi:hypothetical protein